MIESILYPKKLTDPPQLLVDPETLFSGTVYGWDIPLVNTFNTTDYASNPLIVQYRLIDVCSDGSNTFRLGFVDNIISDPKNLGQFFVTMPFQDVTVEIDEYRCHRWNSPGVDLLEAPDESQVKKTISHQAIVKAYVGHPPTDQYRMFKMKSDKFDNSGSEDKFFSTRAYYGIRYSRGSGFPQDLTNDFPEMYQHFSVNPASQTLAIETVVKVKVDSGNTTNGFKVGVLDTSERLPLRPE